MRRIIPIIILTSLIIVTRLLPHLPNFVPVAAVALAAGVYVGKKWAIILPLVGLLISDIFIGWYDWRLMFVVYGSFAVIGIFSWWLKKHKNTVNIIGASLSASLFFFVTTNLAVWIFSPWYDKTVVGLMYSFEMALPFFRYTLAGDLFYAVVIFGGVELFIIVRELIKHKHFSQVS